MSIIKSQSFEKINPFVRHVHLSGIEPHIQSTLLKAYDYRLIYIYDGKGYILINDIKHIVYKGNLLFWKPGTEYLIHSDPSDNLVIIGINFDFTHTKSELNYPIPPEKAEKFVESEITECIQFTDIEAFNDSFYLKDFQLFESILIEINNEYTIKKKYYNHRICGLFLSLIGSIARYVSSPNISITASFNTIDLILKYIHDHYDEPISNKDIGLRLNFHANYINKLMVLHTGKSLHQYLINYRIFRAIDLMQTSQKSITDIAFSVGFKDINYFSKAFKRKTGKSPRNFMSHSWGPV